MPSTVDEMDVILIAGLWLPSRVWTEVAAELQRLGHRPLPVDLPGVDDGSTVASLADQEARVVGAVDAAERPMVVGHSAASTLAWIAADRRPDAVDRVVMVGGFPTTDGGLYADFFPVVDGVMPFPGWEPFEGPDSVDLDESARQRLAADTVAVPEAAARGVVRLGDERRFDVPVLLVCPEFSPQDAQGWIDAGDVPELRRAVVSFADIDSGHWPMVTRPTQLAALLDAAARDRGSEQ
jgi:pimeloyl-ACP methyl ester carboxylesterase